MKSIEDLKKIRDKLYIKGFTAETIERALADYDFDFDDQKERKTLEKEFIKQKKKTRELSGYLKNKLTKI